MPLAVRPMEKQEAYPPGGGGSTEVSSEAR